MTLTCSSKFQKISKTVSPYQHLEKATVLQSARIFHEPQTVRLDPRRCCTVIGQLLHLQNGMGANPSNMLTSVEATEVFFGVTKLFMSEDASLRRMVYLFIKEVSETCNPDDVIIVTSSLTKDMTCDVDIYRANALRVLSRIIDSGMLGAIERYVKSSIVDSSPQVASAALVSALHLIKTPSNVQIIKRWVSEIQTASSSRDAMVQYHAVLLMYQLKKQDRLAVKKLVQSTAAASSSSALTKVALVRYAASLMGACTPQEDEWNGHFAYLESLLRDKNEMVVFEAAKAICTVAVDANDVNSAVHALQLFLSSPRGSNRFAAMKVLVALSDSMPRAVAKCNEDLESLIGDANRNVSTFAISTLLKTGSESSMERYLKQITNLVSEISDEFKITIVQSIYKLCITYPHRYAMLIGFLANFLRDEGGFLFKKEIIQCMERLLEEIPECKETALLHLCEFIEDCEFIQLSTHVLALLGAQGPSTPTPARYIRFIYNRIILENEPVRAAAVGALAKFGARVPSLRGSILALLEASVLDEDDEVRDRALLAIEVLKQCPPHPAAVEAELQDEADAEEVKVEEDDAAYIYLKPMPLDWDHLRQCVEAYQASSSMAKASEQLTFETLPILEKSAVTSAMATGGSAGALDSISQTPAKSSLSSNNQVDVTAAVTAIPELANLGRIFRTCPNVPLTESETEYVVTCCKHVISPQLVILQFSVTNTLDDQVLKQVRVEVEDMSGYWEAVGEIQCDILKYGENKNCFVVLNTSSTAAETMEPVTLSAELKFHVIQVDPDDDVLDEEMLEEEEGFEEEYPLEDFTIECSDFMSKVGILDFRKSWEELGKDFEVMEKFALKTCSDVPSALKYVIGKMGLVACDGTEVIGEKKKGGAHMLHLCGRFVLDDMPVMARCQIGNMAGAGVVLKMAVRSKDKSVSQWVANCIS